MKDSSAEVHDAVPHDRTRFVVLVSVVAALRMGFASSLAISGDEAYHWEWSRHLAASYWDHPGLTAWLIRLSDSILPDDSELMVRMPAILSLAGTAIVAYLFARAIAARGGDDPRTAGRAGWLAGVIVVFVPVYAALGVYMSTDAPFIFFASLFSYLVWRALEFGGWRTWIGAGLALGFAATGKFLAFAIPPSVFVVLCVHRPYRRWLARPQPWVAMAIAVAVFSPVLLWNANHDWATFRFNFAVRHAGVVGWSWISPLEYFGSQIGALMPLLFVAAVAAAVAAVRGWRVSGTGVFVAGTSLIPLGFFFAASLRRDVGAHWPAAFWFPLLCYVAVRWARLGDERPRMLRWTLRTTIGITVLAHAVALTPPSWTAYDLRYPRKNGEIRLERLNERFGWPELGRHVAAARDEMRRQDPGREVVLLGSSYGVAAGLSFYLPDQGRVRLWAPPRAHGENYRFWDHLDQLAGQSAIFVVKRRYQAEDTLESLRERFAEVGEIEELLIQVDGHGVRSFFLIRCFGYDGGRPF